MATSSDSSRDLYVLGTLSRGKTHGHDLMKTIRVSHADRWVSLSEKHVYYVLRKLASRGWVNETEERDSALPPRKVYELTPAGRVALADLLRSQALREAFVPSPFDAVFGMLAYTDVLSRDQVLEILRARREVLARRRAEDALPKAGRLAIARSFGHLARCLYEKAQILLEAELGWLDAAILRIERSDWAAMRVPDAYLEQSSLPAAPAKKGEP